MINLDLVYEESISILSQEVLYLFCHNSTLLFLFPQFVSVLNFVFFFLLSNASCFYLKNYHSLMFHGFYIIVINRSTTIDLNY